MQDIFSNTADSISYLKFQTIQSIAVNLTGTNMQHV